MNTESTQTPESLGSPLCCAFEREYMGIPRIPTDQEIQLRELAEEYHELCESYDRRVCSGPIKDGSIMPADGWESGLINRNALAVRDRLGVHAARLGFRVHEWNAAIRSAGIHYKHNTKAQAPRPEKP